MTARESFANLVDIEALERHPPPAGTTPYGLIRDAAQRWPQRVAFTWLPDAELSTPPQTTTYAQLLADIHRAANALRALGVGPQDAVALLAPNMPQAHAVLWGAQLAGRVCPINTLLAADHIAALLQASGAKVVVALGPHPELAVWPAVQQACEGLEVVRVAIDAGTPAPDAHDLASLMQAQPDVLGFEPDLNPDRVAGRRASTTPMNTASRSTAFRCSMWPGPSCTGCPCCRWAHARCCPPWPACATPASCSVTGASASVRA
jgi:fatty-acyl-CoA synthase